MQSNEIRKKLRDASERGAHAQMLCDAHVARLAARFQAIHAHRHGSLAGVRQQQPNLVSECAQVRRDAPRHDPQQQNGRIRTPGLGPGQTVAVLQRFIHTPQTRQGKRPSVHQCQMPNGQLPRDGRAGRLFGHEQSSNDFGRRQL